MLLFIACINITYMFYVHQFILVFYSSARHNKIERIDQDAFEEIDRLLEIFLDHNKITELKAKTFNTQSILEVL